MKKKILLMSLISLATVTAVGQAKIRTCTGEFYNKQSETEVYNYFKSYDGAEHWVLTINEIGYEPVQNTEYTLIYNDNNTTTENKNCDCLPEWNCECEVYDDEFIGIVQTAEIYPRTMIVREIDYNDNTVLLRDTMGYDWKLNGTEDWMRGDICSCIMWNNRTTDIVDDVILDTRYCGTTMDLFWKNGFLY